MNGYDFDDTIFKGNSFFKFSFYCLWRLPYLIIFAPLQIVAVILRALRIINKNTYLWALGLYVALVPNVSKHVNAFWDKNMRNVKGWYLRQRKDDDVIVSASPAYLICEVAKRLGLRYIASEINAKTGAVNGVHCHGQSKVDSFCNACPDVKLATYYSDSLTDVPMFKFAGKGYLVKGDKITLLYQDGKKVSSK